jgi:DNA segregation ATPase FtsK/SpoIIIE, S-DNA-T family
LSTLSLANPFKTDRLRTVSEFDLSLDVASIDKDASDRVLRHIDAAANGGCPKIAVLTGTPGNGKTHVMGRVKATASPSIFVFVPQLEVNTSPAEHFHWHLVERLFEERPNGKKSELVSLIGYYTHPSFCSYFDQLPYTVRQVNGKFRQEMQKSLMPIYSIFDEAKEPQPYLQLADSITRQHPDFSQPIVRALVLGCSPFAHDAKLWLRGESVDESRAAMLGLPDAPPTIDRILRTVAKMARSIQKKKSLVICWDQPESILTQPEALRDMTAFLQGWIDGVPNLMILLSCLKDDWAKFKEQGFSSFGDRCETIDFAPLSADQAVELLKLRLKSLKNRPAGASLLWPFNEANIRKHVNDPKKQFSPRGLLKLAATVFDNWLAKKSSDTIDIDVALPKPPIEDLFRSEWDRTFSEVKANPPNPDDLQEGRIFGSIKEAFEIVAESKNSINGIDVVDLNETKFGKYKCAAITIHAAPHGHSDKFTSLVVVTKKNGGASFTTFIQELQEAVAADCAGVVLVRPMATLSIGAKTIGRKVHDQLKNDGLMRPYALTDHPEPFHRLECLRRMIEQAEQKNLQLGTETVDPNRCRQLVAKVGVLNGLNLFDLALCGWKKAASAKETPSATQAAVAASPSVRKTESSAAQPAATATAIAPPPTVPADPPRAITGTPWAAELMKTIAAKLKSWGQPVAPLGVDMGPSFARLKFQPLDQTSVGKIRNRAPDMKSHIHGIDTVPIIGDQPGYVSIDLRRPDPQPVTLDDCMKTMPEKMQGAPALPLGKDVAGKVHWLDLSDSATCHLLVAGTTGSGKSEFLKSILAGLAAHLSPTEIEFLLIDPKRVTFNFSGKSPYFKKPIAHTIEEAIPLAEACALEMDRRYAMMQKLKVEHIGQVPSDRRPVRTVLIMDEFADLMTDKASKKEFETLLRRLGGMARAAGIHLVLATQRPDASIVTPVLRSNLPTKICLRVDSEKNSNIILDEPGGEHLLGRGDMLCKIGGGTVRLQGAYVGKGELAELLKIEA